MGVSICFSWFFWRGEEKAQRLLWLRTGGERKINFLRRQDGNSEVVEAGPRSDLSKTRRVRNSPFGWRKIVGPKTFTYFRSMIGQGKGRKSRKPLHSSDLHFK